MPVAKNKFFEVGSKFIKEVIKSCTINTVVIIIG